MRTENFWRADIASAPATMRSPASAARALLVIQRLLGRGAAPGSMLVLTGDRDAANVAQHILDLRQPMGLVELQVAQFGSMPRLLSTEVGLTMPGTALNHVTAQSFMRSVYGRLPLREFRPIRDPFRNLPDVLDAMKYLRMHGVDPLDYPARVAALTAGPSAQRGRWLELAETYQAWQQLKEEHGVYQFADVVAELSAAGREPQVREALALTWQHVVVVDGHDMPAHGWRLLDALFGLQRTPPADAAVAPAPTTSADGLPVDRPQVMVTGDPSLMPPSTRAWLQWMASSTRTPRVDLPSAGAAAAGGGPMPPLAGAVPPLLHPASVGSATGGLLPPPPDPSLYTSTTTTTADAAFAWRVTEVDEGEALASSVLLAAGRHLLHQPASAGGAGAGNTKGGGGGKANFASVRTAATGTGGALRVTNLSSPKNILPVDGTGDSPAVPLLQRVCDGVASIQSLLPGVAASTSASGGPAGDAPRPGGFLHAVAAKPRRDQVALAASLVAAALHLPEASAAVPSSAAAGAGASAGGDGGLHGGDLLSLAQRLRGARSLGVLCRSTAEVHAFLRALQEELSTLQQGAANHDDGNNPAAPARGCILRTTATTRLCDVEEVRLVSALLGVMLVPGDVQHLYRLASSSIYALEPDEVKALVKEYRAWVTTYDDVLVPEAEATPTPAEGADAGAGGSDDAAAAVAADGDAPPATPLVLQSAASVFAQRAAAVEGAREAAEIEDDKPLRYHAEDDAATVPSAAPDLAAATAVEEAPSVPAAASADAADAAAPSDANDPSPVLCPPLTAPEPMLLMPRVHATGVSRAADAGRLRSYFIPSFTPSDGATRLLKHLHAAQKAMHKHGTVTAGAVSFLRNSRLGHILNEPKDAAQALASAAMEKALETAQALDKVLKSRDVVVTTSGTPATFGPLSSDDQPSARDRAQSAGVTATRQQLAQTFSELQTALATTDVSSRITGLHGAAGDDGAAATSGAAASSYHERDELFAAAAASAGNGDAAAAVDAIATSQWEFGTNTHVDEISGWLDEQQRLAGDAPSTLTAGGAQTPALWRWRHGAAAASDGVAAAASASSHADDAASAPLDVIAMTYRQGLVGSFDVALCIGLNAFVMPGIFHLSAHTGMPVPEPADAVTCTAAGSAPLPVDALPRNMIEHRHAARVAFARFLQQQSSGVICFTPPRLSTPMQTFGANKRALFLDEVLGPASIHIPGAPGAGDSGNGASAAPAGASSGPGASAAASSPPATISFSRLSAYSTCPHRVFLSHVISLPGGENVNLTFGRGVHAGCAAVSERLRSHFVALLPDDDRAAWHDHPLQRAAVARRLHARLQEQGPEAQSRFARAWLWSVLKDQDAIVAAAMAAYDTECPRVQQDSSLALSGAAVNAPAATDTDMPWMQDALRDGALAMTRRFFAKELRSLHRATLTQRGAPLVVPLLVEEEASVKLPGTQTKFVAIIDRVDAVLPRAPITSAPLVAKQQAYWPASSRDAKQLMASLTEPTLLIRDLKTSSSAGAAGKSARAYQLQLELYSSTLRELGVDAGLHATGDSDHADVVHIGRIEHLQDGGSSSYQIAGAERVAAFGHAREVVDRIAGGHFDATPGFHCNSCQYANACKFARGVRAAAVSDVGLMAEQQMA